MPASVKFEEVAHLLAAQGWRHDADMVTSPSGGFWFDSAMFERGIRGVYDPAARRVHAFGRQPEAHELYTLLRALEHDSTLAALGRGLDSVESELAEFALTHGMTLSRWGHGYPSVSARARHPRAGVAVVECEMDAAPAFELHAYHWIDDYERYLRLLRRRHFPGGELTELLPAALAFLLECPDHSCFQTSTLARLDDDRRASEEGRWAAYSVLR